MLGLQGNLKSKSKGIFGSRETGEPRNGRGLRYGPNSSKKPNAAWWRLRSKERHWLRRSYITTGIYTRVFVGTAVKP